MSHRKTLEKALEHLLQEDTERASELIHKIVVEKARTIYEQIVEEEDLEEITEESEDDEDDEGSEKVDENYSMDEADVGGDASEDFTSEISSDMDEVDADEMNDGEVEDDEEDHHGDVGGNEALEDKVEDLEMQLDELRAEFEKLTNETGSDDDMDMDMDMDSEDDGSKDDEVDMEDEGEEDEESFKFDETYAEEDYDPAIDESAPVYEKKKQPKLEVAKQAKKQPKGKRADEETQFLSKVADTGQKGTAKLVGAGTNSKLGAEQTKSTFTSPPSKKDYGGKPVDFTKGTGGEYGKYHGDSAKDDTLSTNVGETPKKAAHKADATPKYTGGKAAGEGNTKSPLSKKPV